MYDERALPFVAVYRKERLMNRNLFMKVDEVMSELGVSKPYAYKLMKQLNDEMAAKGYVTISGRVNRKYLEEKIYGANLEYREGEAS